VFVLPAAANAHAYLVRTVPSASGTVNTPPKEVRLTYDEAVEPRFAFVSVTDKDGHRLNAGPTVRDPNDPRTLVVPLERAAEGWYLVYWRVISADGHPVRSAFTFAIGPNPGPAPEFPIPSISETAATPSLITARWAMFVLAMAAIGLFVLRIAIARPVAARVPGTSLRPLDVAFLGVSAAALVAIPVYLLLTTAEFALRSVTEIGTLVPLVRDSSFGRGYSDLELCFALFALAAALALWLDRPDRPQRSLMELLACTGAFAAGAVTLLIPGDAGHAAQTPPRGLALGLDWLHLASASVWIGGLVGLIVLALATAPVSRVAALAVTVPRFSVVAIGSVALLLGSGIWASVLHLPTLGSLWETSYGQALIAKIALLATALALASVNLLRTRPALQRSAKDPDRAAANGTLLRRLVTGEAVLLVGALLAAAILTSLAPPSKALAQIGRADARVGPGPVTRTVRRGNYRLDIRVTPNQAAVPNDFAVRITRDNQPVRNADVTVTFAMLDMEMGQQEYRLSETSPGFYSHNAPALVMVGHWGLNYTVTPSGGTSFDVLIADHATG
jgi:copper transport protein